MRKRWAIALVAVLLMSIAVVAFWPGEKEPVYNGKKLSEWLEFCERGQTGELSLEEIDAGPDAIRQIGADALPYLVKWIQYEPPLYREPNKLQRAWVLLRMRLHLGGPWRGPGLTRGQRRAKAVLIGFRILGPEARAAAPTLARLVVGQTNRYSSTASCAEDALRYIRAESVPALLKALDDPSQPSRVRVAEFLGLRNIIGTNASLVVPVLAKCLDDPDAEFAAAAAMALGQLRAEPEIAVPSLIKAAQNTNYYTVRSSAWHALEQIAPEVLLTNKSSQGHE